MKITVLGSGSCVPEKSRAASSYLFNNSEISELWLVDCGEGTLRRLAESGTDYRKLKRIFISHVHPDHISDLIPLIQALNYTPGYSRTEPVYVYGSDDVEKYLNCLIGFSLKVDSDFPLIFVHLHNLKEVKEEDWDLLARRVKHTGKTLGFRWNIQGKKIAYGADSGYCDELVKLGKDTDFFILESSFKGGERKEGHLTIEEAGQIARNAGTSKLLLTHFYPDVSRLQENEIIGEVRKTGFSEEIVIAEDLLEIILK